MTDSLLLHLLEKPDRPLTLVDPRRIDGHRQYFNPGRVRPELYHPVAKPDPERGWYVSLRRPVAFVPKDFDLRALEVDYLETQDLIRKAAQPMLMYRATGGERLKAAVTAFREQHRYLSMMWFERLAMRGCRIVWPENHGSQAASWPEVVQ